MGCTLRSVTVAHACSVPPDAAAFIVIIVALITDMVIAAEVASTST
jgi:hypothetical protein